MRNIFYFIALILLFSGCSKHQKEDNVVVEKKPVATLFEKVSETHSTISFKNKVEETLYFNFLNYSYIYNGGGVAVGDINNDGLEDIYFSSNQGTNKLYLNKGGFVFDDITKNAGVTDDQGWSTGVSMIDINADGWLDIYVCKSGALRDENKRKNKLYINQKNGKFIEQADQYGLASSAFSTQAYYLDFDKDGDLDVYLLNHRPDFNNNVNIDPRIQFNYLPESSDQLFENKKGKFIDITQKSGLLNKAWGLSASIGDFNEDDWPDVYVANDFLESDFLYINNHDGTFTNTILNTFDHITANSMGSDFVDINNDLKPDLVVLDMVSDDHKRSKENMASMSTENFNELVEAGYHHQYMSNALQLNLGNGVYSEIGQLSGISKTDWSWAPVLADFDNDGFNDLFVTNGILHDLSNQDFRNKMKTNIRNRKKVTLDEAIGMMPSTKLSNKMFLNKGNLTFSPVTEEWGLQEKVNSNGVAYADLDNDGDLDLILNNQMETASIYKNNQENNYISITLSGNDKNPKGIGAKVSIYTKNQQQLKENYPVRGFQSSVSQRLHFGLGDVTTIDSIQVQWPEGRYAILKGVKSNQLLTIHKKEAELATKRPKKQQINTPAVINASQFGIHYKNTERSFDDYKLQLLLPQKQSEKGRALIIDDVNNDGKDDFFVGNAKGAPAAIYIQKEDGTFRASSTSVFQNDKEFEDNQALFFDIDNDGDQDLYVASGSYEDQENSNWLIDRVYTNDGKGNFTRDTTFPKVKSISSAIAASDIDNDGDLDLFIGGGVVPGKYPMSSPSYVLRNDQGNFVNATHQMGKGLEQIHMANGAIFSDYDKDGDEDLLVIGEWMPITIFDNDKGVLVKKDIDALQNTSGWYFTIQSTDIDSDGDTDYLIGNMGQNTKFHPTKDKPLHIYAKDFDQNRKVDIILSKESKTGMLLPVRGKQCSSEQLPMLNNKFKTYKEFANASLSDIYGDQDLREATHYTATNFNTVIMLNNGKGDFSITSLPVQAQFGPTTDFIVEDFNNDGVEDVFGVGSLYEAEVETIRYDANKGYFLYGNKENNQKFSIKLPALQGLQIKAAERIMIGDKKYILLLCKNEELKLLPIDF
ncbi:VCBS repeat protein [Aquimarina sp. MAR_2010_214]|uniref:VCBS repeat-containing protein n=1 Tax=Aquimarina sp. MAR_2010_214 TaxID=1250026 RepID=UPI000C6FDB9B|nr:VCBS repeat-containing protein [Aquimarina sp. MAR_2010_214]PKV50270.1 VCBS repeat protein [Aquimarina sp. MAR_2010_214]